jgi:ZIP family zinc transporter
VDIPLKLGLIAGGTIFLGLPVARWKSLSDKTRAFLNAVSTGILIFLLVEIMGNAVEWIEDLFQSASAGYPKLGDALTFSGLLIAGLAVGLLGMIFFENYFIRSGKDNPSSS